MKRMMGTLLALCSVDSWLSTRRIPLTGKCSCHETSILEWTVI
jgi:hypothetical protein